MTTDQYERLVASELTRFLEELKAIHSVESKVRNDESAPVRVIGVETLREFLEELFACAKVDALVAERLENTTHGLSADWLIVD